jgi:predicted transcriptional regulator
LVKIEEIASSRARLTIASLLSSRPRTLGELAEATGMSVQGVLKHLRKLDDAGILKEWTMPRGTHLRPRKLYFVEGRKVADYSQDGVIVATLGDARAGGNVRGEKTAVAGGSYDELDALAQDVMILRRRVRELSRKTSRMVDQVVDAETRITELVGALDLTEEERQIAYLIFGEDEPERARAILKEHYGCPDPEAAIRDVVRKIRSERS